MNQLDINANRAASKWSKRELAGRMIWSLCYPLFTFSPRLLWGWRRFLLRCFGAQIGGHVHIHPSVRIFIPWNLSIGDFSSVGFDVQIYNLGYLTIGERVTISQRAHLCGGSHDYRDAAMPLLKLPIQIDDDAWVCADAFVGPGVRVGTGAIAGARSAVFKEVQPWTIVGGNPGKVLGVRRTCEREN
jgi:putative colanic acid biosynthesis acetyltransferase WcaF